MWKVVLRRSFSAAHQLRGNFGACERMHGHNWKVEVSLAGTALNAHGLLMDFRDLDHHLAEVLSKWDHTVLNELPDFQERNPSCENLTYVLFQDLKKRLAPLASVWVSKVEIFETDACSTSYEEPAP
ncbi:MAG: 6-carboxytetrahydropterin synthase QueD [Acidobacteria bacterium]|nr:6-carboxytetrahydropterin synthase QueD [Acidobacteriota bacterium]MCB9398425.1 6-carboxytetrahydropterin synthase QueD [Acidobacteriota bacterium]